MSSTDHPANDPAADPAALPYEAAREELLEVVRRLESGQADLEESLALWERGEALAARCQQVLDEALARLDGLAQPEAPSTSGTSADTTSTR